MKLRKTISESLGMKFHKEEAVSHAGFFPLLLKWFKRPAIWFSIPIFVLGVCLIRKKLRKRILPTNYRLQKLCRDDKFSDIVFNVQCGDNHRKILGHRAMFAIVSDVFEQMLYGNLAEKDEIQIIDVEPNAFMSLKEFVYTDEVEFYTVDHAKNVYAVADKYNVVQLVKFAERYLLAKLSPNNVIKLLSFSRIYSQYPESEKKCLDLIKCKTVDVLNSNDFKSCDFDFLKMLVCSSELYIKEVDLFNAIEKWVKHNKGLKDAVSVNFDEQLRYVITKIRFLSMTIDEFTASPGKSELLSVDEKYSLMANICKPGSVELPKKFCSIDRKRFWFSKNVDQFNTYIPFFSLFSTNSMTLRSVWLIKDMSYKHTHFTTNNLPPAFEQFYYSPAISIMDATKVGKCPAVFFIVIILVMVNEEKCLYVGLKYNNRLKGYQMDTKWIKTTKWSFKLLRAEKECVTSSGSWFPLSKEGEVMWIYSNRWSWLCNEGYLMYDELKIEVDLVFN